ncbi:MAG: hypothetical protein HW390_2246 [Candidatus Brocadiaceae bacterium]|nr:hypothetical protein [Candidatus Brocadiaceae bacterium]
MQYRRSKTPGATFFFTVVTYRRSKILCHEANVALIKEAFLHVTTHHPFRNRAFVLLPDHIHCLWTLPENDDNFLMILQFRGHHTQALALFLKLTTAVRHKIY